MEFRIAVRVISSQRHKTAFRLHEHHRLRITTVAGQRQPCSLHYFCCCGGGCVICRRQNQLMQLVRIVLLLLVSTAVSNAVDVLGQGQSEPPPPRPSSYMICNTADAAEQLLYHAANIAALHLHLVPDMYQDLVDEGETGKDKKKKIGKDKEGEQNLAKIRIPNFFIFHAEKSSEPRKSQRWLPTTENSVPLSRVLDTERFISGLQNKLGILAQLDVPVPPDSLYHEPSYYQELVRRNKGRSAATTCNHHGLRMVRLVMSSSESSPNHGSHLIQDILSLMEPGGTALDWVDFILKEMPDGHHDRGICVHHRYGPNWRAACEQLKKGLGSLVSGLAGAEQEEDGIYSGNCDLTTSSTYQLPTTDKVDLNDDSFTVSEEVQRAAERKIAADTSTLVADLMKRKYAGSAFTEALVNRGLTKVSLAGEKGQQVDPKFVFFYGEVHVDDIAQVRHKIPPALSFGTENQVFGHAEFWASTRRIKPKHVVGSKDDEVNNVDAMARDAAQNNAEFWRWVDYFVCREMRTFVGNSVSVFGALQIAARLSGSTSRPGDSAPSVYWYNSRSIPLAQVWKGAFDIPIFFTYAEVTDAPSLSRYHLMAAVSSLRKQMPRVSISILYNGYKDQTLLQWLRSQNVLVHEHAPLWKEEGLLTNGNMHFGTWQPVDIPLYADSEYCLFLDITTLVRKPIDVIGSGWNLTLGLALSADVNPLGVEPLDPGVMLMNIPYLQKSYRKFMNYIEGDRMFEGQLHGPNGAYNTFYRERVELLPSRYSTKPYWPAEMQPHADILHFHGPSAADYIRNIAGQPCFNQQDEYLASQGAATLSSGVCQSLALFAKNVPDAGSYCALSFSASNTADASGPIQFCKELLNILAPPSQQRRKRFWQLDRTEADPCFRFTEAIQRAIESVPARMALPRKDIAQRFGFQLAEPDQNPDFAPPPGAVILSGFTTTLMGGSILGYLFYRTLRHPHHNLHQRRKQRIHPRGSQWAMMGLLLVATLAWLVVCFIVLPVLWTNSHVK